MAAIAKTSVATPPETPAPSAINELATQFGEPPNQFMLLTNVGLTFLSRRRAVDYLRAVLEELQAEGSVQPIIEFRDRCAGFPNKRNLDLTFLQFWQGPDLFYASRAR
jgi:nuclear pore complex protein Nup155